MENMNKCPGCSHHCDRNNLQCGKGEAIFNGEMNPDSSHSNVQHEGRCCGHHAGKNHGHCEKKHHDHCEGKHHGHCEGKRHGHGHHRPEFPSGSLADLMVKCGHRLFHSGDKSMFAVLTQEETAVLEDLLNKILSN